MVQTVETDAELEQNANESALKPQRIKITRFSDDSDKKTLHKRLKDVEICVPIAYGTIAFWLGRKATESQSHKWTVYVRGATNENLGVVIKRAVFQLHPSFNNPVRVVESPPFELSECGWGEFEIAISLFFHDDVCEKQLDLYHHLKLYAEDESGPQSTKKPVVVETYNEIVFPEPSEDFYARVQKHPAVVVPRLPVTLNLPSVPVEDLNEKKGDTKDHPLSQWFNNFSEADELLKLAHARQRVQDHIIKLRRQLSIMDGLPLQSWKPPSDQHYTDRRLVCIIHVYLSWTFVLVLLDFGQAGRNRRNTRLTRQLYSPQNMGKKPRTTILVVLLYTIFSSFCMVDLLGFGKGTWGGAKYIYLVSNTLMM